MKEAICIFQLSSNGLVILDLGCSYLASQISSDLLIPKIFQTNYWFAINFPLYSKLNQK